MILWLGGLAAFLLFFRALGTIFYNLFFHPLRRYPGPIFHRASRLAWIIHSNRGRLPFYIHDLHQRYGPIIRTAPDELSFTDPAAWRDIYGFRTGAHGKSPEFPKWLRLYKTHPDRPATIITAGPEKHALLRRSLAHGFSERSMREQESIIGGYVDRLVSRLRAAAAAGGPINMVNWYTYTTFDVIGDLALSSPFGCLDKSDFHPWVAAIGRSSSNSLVLLTAKLLGGAWLSALMTNYGMKDRKDHADYITHTLLQRKDLGVERSDFIEGLLKREKDHQLTFAEVKATASTLIVAGSETTATVLSGVTYLLLQNPAALRKALEEVRGTFKSEDQITLTSVNGLSYMLACLNEALRMYPPVASGLPRVVPAGGATIAGAFVPADTVVNVPMFAVNHSADNWKDPFEFHPERFMGDGHYASDKFEALQPFSLGPRNCIGRNLAYAEMRLILARVLYNFDPVLADPDYDWINNQRVYGLWKKPPLNIYLSPARK